MACDRSVVDKLDVGPPAVTSAATVYRSDPRATLLFRRLSILLGFF
jgi:hypothetical protein